MAWRVLLVVAVLWSSLLAVRPTRADAADQLWIVASDIHLNPFDRYPDPVDFGRDTNGALFESLLREMHATVPSPAIVLLPGDFLVHDFTHRAQAHSSQGTPDQIALATMRTIAGGFNRTYPHARFAIALGNNDAPCGDYRVSDGDAYLGALARIWAPLVDRQGVAPQFVAQFSRGGYYDVPLPVHGMRLIVLDTVPFSSLFRGECPGANPTGAAQLAWLRAKLDDAPPGTRNVPMMHIPPGYDALVTQRAHGFVPWPFLQGGANATLLQAIGDPKSRVPFAVSGHLHRFDFRFAANVPIVAFGSVSPIYHNNPAFYALHVAPDGTIREIDTYAFDEWNEQWIGPRSFGRTFGVRAIDGPSLFGLHDRLENDTALRLQWDLSTTGWPANRRAMWGSWGANWRIAWCAQTITQRSGEFARCAGIERRVVFFRVAVAVALIVVVGAIVATVVAVRRRRRRSGGLLQ